MSSTDRHRGLVRIGTLNLWYETFNRLGDVEQIHVLTHITGSFDAHIRDVDLGGSVELTSDERERLLALVTDIEERVAQSVIGRVADRVSE